LHSSISADITTPVACFDTFADGLCSYTKMLQTRTIFYYIERFVSLNSLK